MCQVKTTITAVSTSDTPVMNDVLLKTLFVKVTGEKGTKTVRLMFDDGSQRSCITSNVIQKILPPCVSTNWQRNILFGGVTTGPRNVKSYETEITSIDNSFKMKLILAAWDVHIGVKAFNFVAYSNCASVFHFFKQFLVQLQYCKSF